MVRALRDTGVTIILTTHYIEEAEEMADRIGVINKGEIVLVEEKAALMQKLGKKQLTLHLHAAARRAFPPALASYRLELADDGSELVYTFDAHGEHSEHRRRCSKDLGAARASSFKDLQTHAELARGHLRRAW